jgi:hypothetical protein
MVKKLELDDDFHNPPDEQIKNLDQISTFTEKMIKQKRIQLDGALAEYVRAVIPYLISKGEKLEDWTLTSISTSMTMKNDHSMSITQSWRLVRIKDIEVVPTGGDE